MHPRSGDGGTLVELADGGSQFDDIGVSAVEGGSGTLHAWGFTISAIIRRFPNQVVLNLIIPIG